MGHNNYNYSAFIEQAADPRQTFDKITASLAAKFATDLDNNDRITIKFGDWKMWLHYSTYDVQEEAEYLASKYDKPELALCPVRLEIYAEEDDEQYYNEHLYVLETLADFNGVHIYDPVLGSFPYEEQ